MSTLAGPELHNATDRTDEAPARRRNARGEGDKLRAELLDAATDLMATYGDIDSISLRAVARRAGVSATAVYRHFDNHLDLLREAVLASWAEFLGVLTEARALSDDPYERFSTMGRAYAAFAMNRPGQYRVLFSNKIDLGALDGAVNTDGDSAFALLVDTVADILQVKNDHRDAFFVAVQVHTWIHGIVDLVGTHPKVDWPATDGLLDGLSAALDLNRVG
ncbi:MAG: TetR/AcrR family transcriptional regulator [Actinomycetota bacterium]